MSDKTSDRLLPCPFCGGENIKNAYVDWTPAIRCFDCGAVMTVQMDFEGNKEMELKKRWNTRKPMERILEHLKRKKKLILLLDPPCPSRRETISQQKGYCKAFEEAIEIVKEEGGIRNE